MSVIQKNAPGSNELLMGNEAIARGALEAGVQFAAAYPGNPSSEIIGTLSQVAKDMGIYVEWSVNEKVALEAAASASFAGLRALSAMKQNGVNVASDFILNLNLSGVGTGGLVLVAADDPAALSSTNEEDSRFISKLGDLPLLEPATFQEAKDMTKYAFDLSESINSLVIVRSVSRVSHARGNVLLGELPAGKRTARYDTTKIFIPVAAPLRHLSLHLKLKKVQETFENSPFNWYVGPEKPELLMITSGSGWFYSQEAVRALNLRERVGILKVGTTWPLPSKLLAKHMANAKRILFVEEVDPFLENNVKELAAEWSPEIGSWTFYGKSSGHVHPFGEINPDLIINAVSRVMDKPYAPRDSNYGKKALEMTKPLVPQRDLGFCAGCPHRATFWAIKNALKLDGRGGFVTGDIGCYSIGLGPAGFYQLKTMHAMGSGTGLATGFGQLKPFGFNQPVLSVCGDSTFFHAAIPALINGVYNQSNFVLVVLDNSATAMTGFQPHAGTGETATGSPAPAVDIEKLCSSLGVRVETCDPFDLQGTTEKVLDLINQEGGVRVLISRRKCALVKAKGEKAAYKVRVDAEKCKGEACGCARLCTRIFKCPGLIWNQAKGKSEIDEVICTGCGVCADICPQSAIIREENP
ncbi:MAG: 4Fe-4S binding protein [Syntrophaceae bacterium]|nr:4Fe-4S binding protein [Syntrophaceae bacterium]